MDRNLLPFRNSQTCIKTIAGGRQFGILRLMNKDAGIEFQFIFYCKIGPTFSDLFCNFKPVNVIGYFISLLNNNPTPDCKTDVIYCPQ